jgi:hypothetical protein
MREISQDVKVGAIFVAILVVKLDGAGNLLASAHAYLPDGGKHRGIVTQQY